MVLFALQGEQITNSPIDVARVAVPLLIYFAVMWTGSFTLGYHLAFPYDRNASVAFTAAGNNFELAIAVAIAVFGVTSRQAPRRHDRPAHRGPRARRACLCLTLGETTLLPHPREARIVNRIDGAAHTPSDSAAPAVAVGIDYGRCCAEHSPFGTSRNVPHAALEAQVLGSSAEGVDRPNVVEITAPGALYTSSSGSRSAASYSDKCNPDPGQRTLGRPEGAAKVPSNRSPRRRSGDQKIIGQRTAMRVAAASKATIMATVRISSLARALT